MNDPDAAATQPSPGTESSSLDDLPATSGSPVTDSPVDEAPVEEPTVDESPAVAAPADTDLSVASLPDPIPHAGARYAALRLLVLVAVGGILYVVGMRGWLLAFSAVLVSGIISLFLFMKQRNDAAVNIERTVEHWKQRHDHEDAGLAPE